MMNSRKFTYFTTVLLFVSFFSCSFKNAGSPSETMATLREKAAIAKSYCVENKTNTDFCVLVDMGIHSGKNRLFVWDFDKDSVMFSGLCCHGSGKESTAEQPVFSNEEGSYCTSIGKYTIGARAYSKWGIHVHYKLHGLENTNDNAFKRIVVLHSYKYVSENEIYPLHLTMGMSQGCPVVSDNTMQALDDLLKDRKQPTLLWIY